MLCTGYLDVRVLGIDHIEKNDSNTEFARVCVNCNGSKSRKMEW